MLCKKTESFVLFKVGTIRVLGGVSVPELGGVKAMVGAKTLIFSTDAKNIFAGVMSVSCTASAKDGVNAGKQYTFFYVPDVGALRFLNSHAYFTFIISTKLGIC